MYQVLDLCKIKWFQKGEKELEDITRVLDLCKIKWFQKVKQVLHGA